ncbi:MAG: hypothetical protein ACI3YO_04790 [Prevotella sp.]
MKRNRLILLALALMGLLTAQKVCAQTTTQKWAGHTPADVYAGNYTDAEGNAKTSDAAKVLYLYNLGTKQYLINGGRWGTQAALSKQGMPLTMETTGNANQYFLSGSLKAWNGTTGYIEYMTGEQSPKDRNNIYTDRQAGYNESRTIIFEPVEKTGYTNLYRLYITTGTELTKNPGDHYLYANGDTIACTTETADYENPEYLWILVTKQDFLEEYKNAEATDAQPVPAYFVLKDLGFNRNDTDISNWLTGSTRADGALSNNRDNHVIPDSAMVIRTTSTVTTPKTYTYSVVCTQGPSWNRTTLDPVIVTSTTLKTESETIGSTANLNRNKSLTCGHPHSTNSYNSNYLNSQAITLTAVEDEKTEEVVSDKDGYKYYVGNGFTERTDALSKTKVDEDGIAIPDLPSGEDDYWQRLYGGHWTANIHGASGSISQKIIMANTSDPNADNLRSGWYEISCDGFTTDGTGYLFASVDGATSGISDSRQIAPLTTISTIPTTYVKASKTLSNLEGAHQSVTVYVPRADATKAGLAKDGSYIVFGAFVENGTDGYRNSDKEVVVQGSWTCVDNFNIRYLGDPDPEYDIIIDENQTDYDYINGQVDPDGNHTMRLHRTFKTDKWNSLVLPVNLTAGQVKTTFGGDTKLSVLEGARAEAPNRIYFTKVDLSDDDATAIHAGQLYIIKPQVGMTTLPDDADDVTREVTHNSKTFNLSLRTYYTINQVVLDTNLESGDVSTSTVPGASTDQGYLQMVGTYVKKGDAVTSGSKAIPANSYILSDGLWYYSKVAVKNVKGLRGWLETGKSAPTTDVKFFINGVEEGEVTAIEGIESSMEVSKRINSNIYNLNGQLVRSNSVSAEGLDKGIYIIGGKKVVVK